MDTKQNFNFLFAIATETKRSLESPVILLTLIDYAEGIFASLLDMWTELMHEHQSSRVANIIGTFHRDWLQAVNDIESFKKRTRDTPREHICDAIDFSIKCSNKRAERFKNFIIEKHIPTMPPEKAQHMRNELETLYQMLNNNVSSLCDKQKAFSIVVDSTEYNLKVLDETEELLNWLDHLNDNLAIQYSQVIGLNPEVTKDLTTCLSKILRDIIYDVATAAKAQQKTQESDNESKSICQAVNATDLEMKSIHEQIKILEDRIEKLKQGGSSAVMALKHKTIYLEERIQSLQDLKASLLVLKNKNNLEENMLGVLHVFDHLLPSKPRCRLVEELMKAWKNAISGKQECISIISILSATDMKEMFHDEYGTYTVDKYSRKLYLENDGNVYQLNDINKLVSLSDDEKHVYFYDERGRYYHNEQNERIYKAYETASEYCINSKGHLSKIREFQNGREYWYDSFGRYFLNDKNKRVYCDDEGSEFYENDGLGNLVRIKSENKIEYMECPREPNVSEDSIYLKQAVGAALKKCIARVVLHQPADPIGFLAQSLEDYGIKERTRETRFSDEVALMAEREARMLDTYNAPTAPGSYYSGEGELSNSDPNFVHYQTINPGE